MRWPNTIQVTEAEIKDFYNDAKDGVRDGRVSCCSEH
jgi:hypothetical protein